MKKILIFKIIFISLFLLSGCNDDIKDRNEFLQKQNNMLNESNLNLRKKLNEVEGKLKNTETIALVKTEAQLKAEKEKNQREKQLLKQEYENEFKNSLTNNITKEIRLNYAIYSFLIVVIISLLIYYVNNKKIKIIEIEKTKNKENYNKKINELKSKIEQYKNDKKSLDLMCQKLSEEYNTKSEMIKVANMIKDDVKTLKYKLEGLK